MPQKIHPPRLHSFDATARFLEGQLLVAMPTLLGSCFEKSVIYLCAHTAEGAMGIIINNPMQSLEARDILHQLNIAVTDKPIDLPIHFGGPVDAARGFVLHSTDFTLPETVMVSQRVGLTANIEVLRAIAKGIGPTKKLLALGYAGWTAGQLEREIEENSWLVVPASPELIFDTMNEAKWRLSAEHDGIDLLKLSTDIGHA